MSHRMTLGLWLGWFDKVTYALGDLSLGFNKALSLNLCGIITIQIVGLLLD